MHSTFLKRKHYKNEKINNENLNNERKEEIKMKINGKTNSSLVMSPLSNISSHNQVMNLDSVNCNYGGGIHDPYGSGVETYRMTRDRLKTAVTQLIDTVLKISSGGEAEK